MSGVAKVAEALLGAWRGDTTVEAAPLAGLLRDAQDAYAVQERVAAEAGWFDRPVPLHWKSGGPSREAVLTHAPLPPRRVWESPASAVTAHFNLRLIEAEVALRLA
ncbi:MAG TPA: 2-keto-4-pentenoate hydratase, partial [Ramlibacter sp.]|nr:2-keto-4-pentenoate hydratase [Ramlibacter sp.]